MTSIKPVEIGGKLCYVVLLHPSQQPWKWGWQVDKTRLRYKGKYKRRVHSKR